jgi:hypothetical protein
VIRFSALLVAVAVGVLVAGVVTSKLTLVYVAIGVSGVALLALAVGALVKRKELFGPSATAEPQLARPEPAAGHVAPQAVPWGAATVPAAPAWSAATAQPAPSRAGYLPAEQPPPPQQPPPQPRRPAAFTPRPPAGPPSPAPGVPVSGPSAWEWPPDAPATQEMPRIGAAPTPPAPAPPAPVPPSEWPAPAAAFVPKVASPPPEAVVPADVGPPSAEPSPASESQPLPQDQPAPAEDQHEAEDQPQDSPPAEQTQQLPVAEAADTTEAPEPPDTPEAPDTADLQREVTVVPGVPRYHTPQCLLIRFMGEDDLAKMTLGAARQAGCTPCRACLPDQADADPELDPPQPERQAEITLDVLSRRTPLSLKHLKYLKHLGREDLAGDQPRVLGHGRDHIRVR